MIGSSFVYFYWYKNKQFDLKENDVSKVRFNAGTTHTKFIKCNSVEDNKNFQTSHFLDKISIFILHINGNN